jgi:hypothetical protein|tara:strand:+ start:554 stop:922 length:369 start_codon:yes stop_codon:yes gene_type:complete
MQDPRTPMMQSMLLLIVFLLLFKSCAFAGEKSEWLNDNPCMIKVIIKEKCLDSQCLITETTKEEVLKCKDGYDGPNYWELFAQFYYADLTVPAYCREVARPDHPFKTPGMVCLSENGVWEKK